MICPTCAEPIEEGESVAACGCSDGGLTEEQERAWLRGYDGVCECETCQRTGVVERGE